MVFRFLEVNFGVLKFWQHRDGDMQHRFAQGTCNIHHKKWCTSVYKYLPKKAISGHKLLRKLTFAAIRADGCKHVLHFINQMNHKLTHFSHVIYMNFAHVIPGSNLVASLVPAAAVESGRPVHHHTR